MQRAMCGKTMSRPRAGYLYVVPPRSPRGIVLTINLKNHEVYTNYRTVSPSCSGHNRYSNACLSLSAQYREDHQGR
jgi:hypothetical protein